MEENMEWLINYLHLFNAYIQLGVTFDNLDDLDFCTPNAEKTNRGKFDFEFPPNY